MEPNLNLEAVFKETFFHYATEATARVQSQGGRFAYYTTAATALQVLRGRELWMRSTLVMNDFMEVQHGVACLVKAYQSKAGQLLDAQLDKHHPGVSAEVKALFEGWTPGMLRDTFVTCLSEHPAQDDQHGRLSMWRAYGGSSGVALILNGGVLFRPSTALAAYASPVAYLDALGVEEQLALTASRLTDDSPLLKGLGREATKNAVFQMLRLAAVSTKHPAFREEKEWRVVASPALQSSPLLPVSIETVGGVPQRVLKIKLQDHPDKGLWGLEPSALLDRVLIGPCEHPDVTAQAFFHVLQELGVQDPWSKIFQSGVPLRANQR